MHTKGQYQPNSGTASFVESCLAIRGHGINTPGLSGHSVGDTYPYTVIAQGDIHNTLFFKPMNLITGECGYHCDTYAGAQDQITLFAACCDWAAKHEAEFRKQQDAASDELLRQLFLN